MGFGLLFFGYLVAQLLSINLYRSFFRLAGYAILLTAMQKLSRHNRFFAYSRLTAIPLVLISLAQSGIALCGLLGVSLPESVSALEHPLESALLLFVLLFHVCLLLAVYTIAVDTELPKLARGARLNLVLTAAYGLLEGIRALPVQLGDSYAGTLYLMAFLLFLIWTLSCLLLFFRCYMWICLEGDEDMAQKPSRFAFVNAMRARAAEKEQKAADEAAAYARDKRARYRAALGPAATKPKHHRKKKKKK